MHGAASDGGRAAGRECVGQVCCDSAHGCAREGYSEVGSEGGACRFGKDGGREDESAATSGGGGGEVARFTAAQTRSGVNRVGIARSYRVTTLFVKVTL